MKLSRDSEYGLRGLVFLAGQPGNASHQLNEIADATALTRPFMAKIFVRLARSGVVRSHRGRERGYTLSRPADQIGVRQVVEAIEGADVFARCIFWTNACSDINPCILHRVWDRTRPAVGKAMEGLSIADLSSQGDRSFTLPFERRRRRHGMARPIDPGAPG